MALGSVKTSFIGVLLVALLSQLVLGAGFVLWRQGDSGPQRKQEVVNLLHQQLRQQQQLLQQQLQKLNLQSHYLAANWPGLTALIELDDNHKVHPLSRGIDSQYYPSLIHWQQQNPKPSTLIVGEQVMLLQSLSLPKGGHLIALHNLTAKSLGLSVDGPWQLQLLNKNSAQAQAVLLSFTEQNWSLIVLQSNPTPISALLLLVLLFAVAISYSYSHYLQSRILALLRDLGGLVLPLPQLQQFNTTHSLMTRLKQTLRKQNQQQQQQVHDISRLQHYDILTGVLNRQQINNVINQAMSVAKHEKNSFAMILIGIKRFRQLNNGLGQQVGDEILKQFATRLHHYAGDQGQVVRVTGDEFMLLMPGKNEAEGALAAQEIKVLLQQTMDIKKQRINCNVKQSVVLYPQHGGDSETLFRRGQIHLNEMTGDELVYQAGAEAQYLRDIELLNELEQAIEDDQLVIYFQPKVRLKDHKVHEVETLVRWQHPSRGWLRPDEFVPLMESRGDISKLSNWVLNCAIKQQAKWQQMGFEFASAINLSPLDLLDIDLPQKIVHLLVQYNVDPSSIVLEITESAVMQDAALANEVLGRLKACGIGLSLDDFGTGYSSLAQLRSLPFDELKIDKTFVTHLDQNEEDALVVKTIIDLAHNMGLKVTAEGVESQGVLQYLQSKGCDAVQGYAISRPLKAEALIKWLQYYQTPTVVN